MPLLEVTYLVVLNGWWAGLLTAIMVIEASDRGLLTLFFLRFRALTDPRQLAFLRALKVRWVYSAREVIGAVQ